MCYFAERYNNLSFPIDSENSKGLRNAQLGAVHAIAAFSTLRKKSAGIVVMPTGSGKTAVLMMTPYMQLSRKVLIVTPSKMVRGQIFDDFSNLGTLKKARVFMEDELPPAIFELKKLYSEDFREKIESVDVVVASPPCALSLSENGMQTGGVR